MHLFHSFSIAFFSALVHARTDLTGCTRTDVSSPAGASYAWIVPETGELCDFLDCGGGRAPPKTTVPGCALFVGTETYKPSFLAGFSASMTIGGVGSIQASATTTAAPTFTTSTTAATTAAVDDGTDAVDDNDGDADDDEDIYDLSDLYPTGWIDMTPQQKSDWVSSYWSTDSAATATAMASAAMTGPSTSAQQSTTTSNVMSASSGASSTSTSAVSIGESTATSTTSTRDLPTLTSVSTSSALVPGSLSMSRSWVKTIPTFARGAADVDVNRASVSASGSAAKSASASASLVDSTGAAGKVKCAVGAVGVMAAIIGVLAVL
ncbi:hypothetical protein QM012_000961 [Aureobasidium pullulans]|uniref:Siderophore biosynthesis n=1 Tax=Aureobasidium pullulans TaxID=5580 RepID=A0ABR0TGF5_AURPU